MRKINTAALALLAAVVLSVAAWVLALASSPVTGPQPMAWHKADGSPPTAAAASAYPFRGCSLADINFDIAAWNGGVILPCHDEALGTGWAFLDPRTRQATLRWPLSTAGEVLYTSGLVPGPGGQLAIVFQQALEDDMLVGTAGPEGWVRTPESLGRVRYLAGAWVGKRLELVVVPLTAEDKYGFSAAVKVVDFEGTERHERVAVPACGNDGCRTPQTAYRVGARWVFEDAGRAIAEGGEPVAPAFPRRSFNEGELDLVAQGKLRTPDTLLTERADTPGIGVDGKPSHSAPPWSGLRAVRQNRFAIGDTLQRRPQWGDASLRAVTEQVGERMLTWYTDSDDRVHITDARAPTVDAMAALPAVARWPQGLASRVFVPDETGGVWLVDSAGESIHLDRALRRTDPLPLRRHLMASRSAMPAYALGWALFGLPVVLVLGVGLSLCIAPRRPFVRGRPVMFAAVLYLVSAGWALLRVVPYL